MTRPTAIQRADDEAAAGRLWRAREILEGNLANTGFDPELYEALGRVLMQMGDVPTAGKFLFLSGARDPDYQPAIELYLQRHGGTWQNLLGTFPRQVRRLDFPEFPPSVAAQLAELGASEDLWRCPGPVADGPAEPLRKRIRDALGCALVVAVGVPLGLQSLQWALQAGRLLPWWIWGIAGAAMFAWVFGKSKRK